MSNRKERAEPQQPSQPLKRIVVKVGSQVLCNRDGGLELPVLRSLAAQISDLQRQGWQPLLVSSGAVASGAGVVSEEPGARLAGKIANPVARKQALAALGQVRLMETWRRFFSEHDLAVAQVLATRSDFQSRRHYLNMRACIEALLDARVVPIVNENDVVSVTELMFTDNDELAGLLAGMVKADLLCLLSTVAGVYDDGGADAGASCIAVWDDQIHQVEDLVQRGTSALGRGGMHSKIAVARKAARLGTEVVIADGTAAEILPAIIQSISANPERPGAEHSANAGATASASSASAGEAEAAVSTAGTRFPARRGMSPAKRWLASAQFISTGSVTVNAGAEAALRDHTRLASVLPVGIIRVDGSFEQGDVVEIRNQHNQVLGCGRARYDHHEARQRQGQQGQKPLVHYDYLYLVD